MNQLKFLLTLADTTKAYSWKVDGNKITGVARNGADKGRPFDPLTAACRYTTNKTYPNTKRGRQSAARVLGLSKLMSNSVQDATQASTNRGHAQVLRGHIKQVLGL
tara:strand:+ start:449 stop:766 length:318 start_codon:yes stop_codon:yes gene_type:complete